MSRKFTLWPSGRTQKIYFPLEITLVTSSSMESVAPALEEVLRERLEDGVFRVLTMHVLWVLGVRRAWLMVGT